jgi:hypothetical protein
LQRPGRAGAYGASVGDPGSRAVQVTQQNGKLDVQRRRLLQASLLAGAGAHGACAGGRAGAPTARCGGVAAASCGPARSHLRKRGARPSRPLPSTDGNRSHPGPRADAGARSWLSTVRTSI